MAWNDRRPADVLAGLATFAGLKVQDDPEAIFQEGWLLCDLGEYDDGLRFLRRAVEKGYFVSRTLASRPEFDALRGDPAFQAILHEAEEGCGRALEAFRHAGGERLLGQLV